MKVYMLIEADDANGHHAVNDEIEISDEDVPNLERLGIVTRRKPKASGGDGG